MYDYLKDSSITNICNSHGMSRPAVTSLANDLRLMMLSDYNAHNRQEEHKLGSNIRCHHIQIDESKFGKRKNHRGHRVEGTLGEKIGTTYPKIIFNFFFFSSTPYDIQAMSIERNLR